jgi:precorrin-2 dehydrogenase
MLPITLDTKMVRVGLAGAGEGLECRAAALARAGVEPVLLTVESSDAALHCMSLLFIAGLERHAAASLAGRARAGGVLVHVEDVPELSDFHMPAVARRGDLTFAVSTGGRAPGLARRLREWLEERFGPEWHGRLDTLSGARARWRTDAVAPNEIARRTRDLVEKEGWL